MADGRVLDALMAVFEMSNAVKNARSLMDRQNKLLEMQSRIQRIREMMEKTSGK